MYSGFNKNSITNFMKKFTTDHMTKLFIGFRTKQKWRTNFCPILCHIQVCAAGVKRNFWLAKFL